MLVGFYQRGKAPKSLPVEIEKSIMYLKSVGVKQISLLGICWGGCIVQHMISTGKVKIIIPIFLINSQAGEIRYSFHWRVVSVKIN